MQDRGPQGQPVAEEISSGLRRQPHATEEQQRRWDSVRSIYLVILVALFVGVVGFACYANQYGDWAKAKELLGDSTARPYRVDCGRDCVLLQASSAISNDQ
jgi:hypothetical protein